VICILLQNYFGGQINNDEIEIACSTHGEEEMCVHGFGGEN